MFDRKKYLEKILEEKDSHFIKVITGIRRIGKSTLLNQVRTKFNQNFIIYNFNDARIVKKYK
jgi:predicted AAA+ superfamily ATPase